MDIGYLCPIQGCGDAVYALKLGYCINHCIEFGIVCEKCRRGVVREFPLCDKCRYDGKCSYIENKKTRCLDDVHKGCTRCTRHAIKMKEICTCHLEPKFRGKCVVAARDAQELCVMGCMVATYLDSAYCFLCLKKEHILCAINKCLFPAIAGMQYCKNHHQFNIDAGLVCIEEVCEDGVLAPFSYCTFHCRSHDIMCKEKGCINTGDIFGGYCGKHAKAHGIMCKIDGCYTIIVHTPRLPTICSAHICYICGGVADVDGIICSAHVCSIANCGMLVDEFNKYCEKHRCLLCKGKILREKYCELHACGYAYCKKPRLSDDVRYCFKHKCEIVGCNNSMKCDRHICGMKGCGMCADHVDYMYCINHKCTVQHCSQGRIEGAFVCERHLKCIGCIPETLGIRSRNYMPIHNLDLCNTHACCNMCITMANASMSYLSLICNRMCCDIKWAAYYRRTCQIPPAEINITCCGHKKAAMYWLILCLSRYGIHLNRDILRIIWDVIC